MSVLALDAGPPEAGRVSRALPYWPLPHSSSCEPGKGQVIQERIGRLEEEVSKAREYLTTGQHANWTGFRPLFYGKKNAKGRELPPHKDWVKNVFLRRREKALARAHKMLADLETIKKSRGPKPGRKRGDSSMPF